ncbi:DoxX family membrane protein [Litorivicinus sp.]|jgi:putative oxidoreductase|nr:DoxX family membrane protein [Litorivicinus sp.]MDB9863113.1 DoxX family membrane protein [Litorivicinus sp.]MDC1207872.1 DoxX family membrane protein [Litorivicinus sp.]MDC1239647.1 DoxX family membrane protein [Litorivicinus sp.]MDC1319654.1 DoxX family membrane protein [Litorivicinus sp.]|tara:strand:+ start:216 stop:623 length:408 start_codon:yes stop_codon:yes gene_type:complete
MIEIPKVPAPIAQIFLRLPVSILFLQQGLSKLPVTEATADAFGLPFIVWWFVTYGEIGAGVGLLLGGLIGFRDFFGIGDLITRFSGITMACIMTGVIWISAPSDLMAVLLYDYLHVSMYFVGIYFALRGNPKWNA